MTKRKNAPFLIALAVLLAASACLATLPGPDAAPVAVTPNLTATYLSNFLTSVPRVTVTPTQVILTVTATETLTPFPSITPLPTATATFTNTPFGFFASPTPFTPTDTPNPTLAAPDLADGATDEWGSDFRCSLLSKSPANWTVVPALGKYKVSWTLMNTGRKTWQANAMVLAYSDGNNMTGGENIISLIKDVKVGQAITPVVNIYPPKDPGNYRSIYGLRLLSKGGGGGHVFCTVTVNITVK